MPRPSVVMTTSGSSALLAESDRGAAEVHVIPPSALDTDSTMFVSPGRWRYQAAVVVDPSAETATWGLSAVVPKSDCVTGVVHVAPPSLLMWS